MKDVTIWRRDRTSWRKRRAGRRRSARHSKSGRTSRSTSSLRTCRTPSRPPFPSERRGDHMRITQGTFSYLPDLTDEQIKAQIEYCLKNDWAVSVEHTDDPHPRNV